MVHSRPGLHAFALGWLVGFWIGRQFPAISLICYGFPGRFLDFFAEMNKIGAIRPCCALCTFLFFAGSWVVQWFTDQVLILFGRPPFVKKQYRLQSSPFAGRASVLQWSYFF
jgi:hypothetical protein